MGYGQLVRYCESRGMEAEINSTEGVIEIYTYEGLDRTLEKEQLEMEFKILKCFGKKVLVYASWTQDPKLDCESIIKYLEFNFPTVET